MQLSSSKKRHASEDGFSLLEMVFATVILMVGLVAVAQLVPTSIRMNSVNRRDSAALVFAQRELDQMLDRKLTEPNFFDQQGNNCNLGSSAIPNQVVGSPVVLDGNGRPVINFGSGQVAGYSFLYSDPNDPSGTFFDVRWAVITSVNGTTITGKRFIIGVRQQSGSGFLQPVTLDTTVER
jgi:type II secretory pathway pseudopilin PulG